MSGDLFWENLYQNDEERSQKEFILSYYYTLLKTTGPLDAETLEATWIGQIELFSDVSFYVTHGISNFLLSSNKFKLVDEKIQIVDINSNKKINSEQSKITKSPNVNEMQNMIKIEYPTTDQIIAHNIQRNRAFIESLNSEDKDIQAKLSKSITLKINAIIIFSNVQNRNEIQICIRPAVEYSTHSIHESLRMSGSYFSKYNIYLSDKELDILSCLLQKHLLLLDYRNEETFDYFISNEECVSEINDVLNLFDEYLMDNGVYGPFKLDSIESSNSSYLQSEYFITELKHKYITVVQKFLFECEIQKKILKDKIQEMQNEVLQIALRNKFRSIEFQHKCMNYVIFIRNLIEKQIQSFQNKALNILKMFDEIKPSISSNLDVNFESGKTCLSAWKLRVYEIKEKFKRMRAVFENFKLIIISETMLDLQTVPFIMHKEKPPDILKNQLKEIVINNIICKKRNENVKIHLQILQEYIYGPHIGILKKSKEIDHSPTNDFKEVFSSGFVPKLYFLKPSYNLNKIPYKSETNVLRDSSSLNQMSDIFLKNLKVPNQFVSTTKNVDYEIKLRRTIFKLNKYVFGENSYNRFEIIVNFDCRKQLSMLNMTELSEKLSEYIAEYLLNDRIFMCNEKLRYFDLLLLPITIYFGLQTKNRIFEPFINIKCNFRRADNLPNDIEIEIKKLDEKKLILNDKTTSDESICNQFANTLKLNTSEYPFLNELSNSDVSRDIDLKSILTTCTGAKPKQSIDKKIRKNKYSTLDENWDACCICRETFRRKPKFYLKCKHFFHKQCIQIWHQNHRMCPVCRQLIVFEEFPPL